jgi:tetratricopeptide (TPR) repeat protein
MAALLSAPGPAQENAATSALDRSPSDWSAAAPGRWADWDADVPPPPHVEPYLVRAIRAFERGDMPATLTALFALLEVEPEFPSALHQAGVIYFRLRRYEDAITALERYLEIAPHRIADTRYLAHSYYSLGRYEDAKSHYGKVLSKRPNSPEAHRGLGLCHMRLGEPDAALVELRRVLELDPKHANAATWIAQIHYDEERTEEALDAVTTAGRLDPFDARSWFLKSQIYYELEREEEGDAAKARFDVLDRAAQEVRAIETQLLFEPANPGLFRRLAALHSGTGNVRAEARVLFRWLRIEPWNLNLRITALGAAQETGNRSSAATLAKSLHAVAGDHIDAWRSLAAYYAAVGDDERRGDAASQIERLTRTIR